MKYKKIVGGNKLSYICKNTIIKLDSFIFQNDLPDGVKSLSFNGKTYSREQFLAEREKFLNSKVKRSKE